MIMATILHILYYYPLKNEEGLFASFLRNTVLGRILQATAVYSQLMIIVGLCLDGGKSMTTRARFNQGVTPSQDGTVKLSIMKLIQTVEIPPCMFEVVWA